MYGEQLHLTKVNFISTLSRATILPVTPLQSKIKYLKEYKPLKIYSITIQVGYYKLMDFHYPENKSNTKRVTPIQLQADLNRNKL